MVKVTLMDKGIEFQLTSPLKMAIIYTDSVQKMTKLYCEGV